MSVLWKIAVRSCKDRRLYYSIARFVVVKHDIQVNRRLISTTTATALRSSDDQKSKERLWNQHKVTLTKGSAESGIPKDRLTIKFAKSSGPGGQNVNKVNTKVDVRFHVQSADWLSQEVRDKIVQMEKNRVNSSGELVVSSTKFRSQTRNLEDAIEKIADMVKMASYVPRDTTPEKKAHVRKLIRKANEQRLAEKKFRSSKKKDRKMDS